LALSRFSLGKRVTYKVLRYVPVSSEKPNKNDSKSANMVKGGHEDEKIEDCQAADNVCLGTLIDVSHEEILCAFHPRLCECNTPSQEDSIFPSILALKNTYTYR
jgi:hypothetical protein